MENISDVTKFVIENLTPCTIAELPNASTNSRIIREMGEISRIHAGSVLANEQNITLKYDSTTKQKSHFNSDASTNSRIIREMGEISRIHAGSVLANEQNITLKYDSTTKQKSHFNSVQLSSKYQTFTLAIDMMPSGTSDRFLR